ncbi:MAG: hypothetical protein HY822_08530 [Acidobacteria bacterium]|nr:hypothetical protein [Acidobacteriota bacterium]
MHSRLHSALALALFLTSCTSGPPPVQKGTPPFYWQAANETFAAGDFEKTTEHLSQLIKTQNEFTARAFPWSLVLSAGVANGYLELADTFETGGRQNKANPTPFRRLTSDYRGNGNQRVLHFVGQFQKFLETSKDENIVLAFPFPTGSAAAVPQLARAGSGVLLLENEVATAQRRAIERAVLMLACRAVGAPEDTAKAREVFKPGSPAIPRATFMLAMAGALYNQSQLYVSNRLDQPDRLKTLCKIAGDILAPLPDSKEKKDLDKKIQAALKAN